jgi:predicted DNA-binding antitoxin AbrB/MazE fold protein
MTTAVKAIYEDGVFKPKEPVQLEEKTEVEVLIPSPPAPDPDDPTGWKAIDKLLGSVRSGLTDVSEKHDDYLYGDPHD